MEKPNEKCSTCATPVQLDTFLGWPVRDWFEVQNFLKDHAAKDESPLATLSRLFNGKS